MGPCQTWLNLANRCVSGLHPCRVLAFEGHPKGRNHRHASNTHVESLKWLSCSSNMDMEACHATIALVPGPSGDPRHPNSPILCVHTCELNFEGPMLQNYSWLANYAPPCPSSHVNPLHSTLWILCNVKSFPERVYT